PPSQKKKTPLSWKLACPFIQGHLSTDRVASPVREPFHKNTAYICGRTFSPRPLGGGGLAGLGVGCKSLGAGYRHRRFFPHSRSSHLSLTLPPLTMRFFLSPFHVS